jgi:hypothetical protein
MPDVSPLKTELLDAINTGLSSLGETPVSAPDNTSTNVILAKQIIQEVNRDVQSKGWWFNTTAGTGAISILSNSSPATSSEDFNTLLPEEARRYISIRASRILQARFLGSEDLYKFSMMEEQVSYAVLTQAHVRNGGNGTSFNSFPAALKSMGVEEFVFLQGNAEEKLLTIRLTTELNTAAKLAAETSLLADQEELVTKQALTEVQNALKVIAETSLLADQETLVTKQGLTEIKNALKVVAETSLINDQEALVVKQALTEVNKTLDVAADTLLKGKQGLLLTNQTATELKTALKLVAETSLIGSQDALVVNQTATELKTALKTVAETTLVGSQSALVVNQTATELNTATKTIAEANLINAQKNEAAFKTETESAVEKAFYDGVVTGTQDTYRDYAAEMRMMGVQESTFQQLLAYKKIEVLKDAAKLRQATMPDYLLILVPEEKSLETILRLIGEPTSANSSSNSLARIALETFRATHTELQGRGWWFNTEMDVELPAVANSIPIPADVLSVEANDYDTLIKTVGGVRYLYDLKTKSTTSWTGTVKAKIIYERPVEDVPQKYLEYLAVRVAIILTELYPQSGADTQRLPKMEAELRAYFKDREFDEANYTVFDNYDTAARIGINRNYNLF